MIEHMYGSPWLRYAIFGIALLMCFLPIIFYKKDDFMEKYSLFFMSESDEDLFFNDSRYLVESAKCKIPNINPFNSQVKKFLHPEEYYPCREQELLTYVTKTDNIATLHINAEIAPSYTKNDISCCYSYIMRKENKRNPDNHIQISHCIPFKDKATLEEDFIIVKCVDAKTNSTVYENTHAAITVKNHQVRKKMDMATTNTTNNPYSVLFVGIDSISRLNLVRSLPKTYQYLEENEWMPLKGYNKIAENTFPNLMAILTGYSSSYSYAQCDPRKFNKLDHCPMIWYDFRKLNYVTGFAEDEGYLNTFNFGKMGFTQPPTDFYFRPYILGFEKLSSVVEKDGMKYCTGPESTGERIMNIAKDFAITFEDYPSFGFFWMNSFSHNSINSPTRMDKKVKAFLEDITNSGALENTIMIFFSDHGIRRGSFRYTPVSWWEERLPFIYISLPERFKNEFPNATRNLKKNRHKLTTPYDLYMTLQHILVLSGFDYKIKPSNACPLCKSLFSEIENDRSCEDSGIEQHWCTCAGYTQIDQNNETVKEAAHYIIGEIHQIIHNNRRDFRCAKYSLHKIITARISETFTYKRDVYLLLVFETSPKAIFEATVLYENNANGNIFQLKGGVYRLDSYSWHSKCERDPYMKEYCYCNNAGSSTLLNQNFVINLRLSAIIYFLFNTVS